MFAVLVKGKIFEFKTMALAEKFAASLPKGSKFHIGEKLT